MIMTNIFLIIFALLFILMSIFSFIDGNVFQSISLFICSFIGIIPLFIINSKKAKLSFLFPVIFIIFGVVGGLAYIANISIPNKVSAKAEIVELISAPTSGDEMKNSYPKIKYRVNGETYFELIKSQPGHYRVGEIVEIYYNEKNPKQVNIIPNPLILVITVTFLLIGIIILYFLLRKNIKKIEQK